MSKEHNSMKSDKKKPAMSPKEKKAAKKAKKASNEGVQGFLGLGTRHVQFAQDRA